MDDSTPPLIRHIEKHLGVLDKNGNQRWVFGKGDSEFQIIKITDSPCEGANTYLTLGLSHHNFEQRSGNFLKQELMFSCWEDFESLKPELFVASVASMLLEKHFAIPNGQIIGPNGPILSNNLMESVFCVSPRYHPESLEVFDELEETLVFVWLIPIHNDEVQFEKGCDKFEDVLDEKDPDFLDLERDSIELS
jgi:hypothetical protein